MSRFLQTPALNIGRSRKWRLYDDLVYASDLFGRQIRVPMGFETDLASIPRLGQLLIPVNGKHRAAAIVHDYLYSIRGLLPDGRITRERCDEIFLEAMGVSGVSSLKRWSMYAAVRIGGWASWG